MDYMSAKETAKKWGIIQRRVEVLCLNGQVRGVERVGNMWLIPKGAAKPIDGRTKAVKRQKKPIKYTLTLDTERVIGMVNSTMVMEGMPLTDEDRDRLRTVLSCDATADDIVRQFVIKHSYHNRRKKRNDEVL